ncbi:MAG: hypothetical protein QXU44_07060, partial [Candidatus Caldarchaeum sp.]
ILLVLAIPFAVSIGNHESQPRVRIEDIKEAARFLEKASGEQLIVAHPSIANWLSSTSHSKILPTVNLASFEVADLLTTSSSRIITGYLKIDSWQPFSAAKAPLIHIYDGKTYRPFLYIDDSYSRITLIGPGGEEFVESPYKALYLGHNWLESKEEITLEEKFQSAGLLISKSITVSKSDPVVSIKYNAKALKEAFKIKSFQLNVYSVILEVLPQLDLNRNEGYMKIENHEFVIRYSGSLETLTQDKTKDQRYTIGVFKPLNETYVEGTVTIRSLTAENSGHKVWYAAFNDLARKLGVRYLVIPKEHQVFFEDALPTQLRSLEIIDSFVRYIINSDGKNYVEAPAYASVLNETSTLNRREIWYKTAGLNIKKTVETLERSVDVSYAINPHKMKTYLIMSTLSVWVDWSRAVLSFHVEHDNSSAKLVLDSATFTLKFKGNVSSIVLEPHPEYGQIRVLATYYLNPESDSIGLTIESDKPLIIKYNPTTRPEMKASDSITILTEGGVFRPVKNLNLYTVFEITPP